MSAIDIAAAILDEVEEQRPTGPARLQALGFRIRPIAWRSPPPTIEFDVGTRRVSISKDLAIDRWSVDLRMNPSRQRRSIERQEYYLTSTTLTGGVDLAARMILRAMRVQ